MKRSILFIGYEASLRDEIRDFLKEPEREVFFADRQEDCIRMMNNHEFGTVVLNMHRMEDAAMLRYINLHYQKTHVLVMPDQQLQEAIPAIATGHFDLLRGPFTLEELRKFL